MCWAKSEMERTCVDRMGQKYSELQFQLRDDSSMRAPTLRIPLSCSVQRRLYGDAIPFCRRVLSFHFSHSWARWVSDHQLQDSPPSKNLSSNFFPKAICNRCIKLVFSRGVCISKHSGSSSVALESEKSLLSQRRRLNGIQNNPLPRPNPSCTAWILRLAAVQKTGRCCRGLSTSSCEVSPHSRLTSYCTASIPTDFWP